MTRPRSQAGFTLHEVLIALAMSAVISLAGWRFLHDQLHSLTRQSAGLDAFDKVRAGIGFVARDIRAAGYDPLLTALTVATLTGIREAGDDSIHLEWDRNESGVIDSGAVDPNAESVRYGYDAANRQIVRTVNGVTTPLLGNVPPGGFSLRYFDLDGVAIPTSSGLVPAGSRDDIASVILTIRVDAVGVTPAASYEMASRVAVRARILDRL